MKRIVLFLALATVSLGGNAPINYDTTTHAVKKPPTTSHSAYDYDFIGTSVHGFLGGIVNAGTGFQVAGAAPNGHTLVGNGTAYVDSASGVGGTPGGSNTQVQFNDSSAFGGDAGMTYNKTTDFLTVAGSVAVGTAASGMGTGDMSASRNATDGVVYLGSGGTGYLFRSNTIFFFGPAMTSIRSGNDDWEILNSNFRTRATGLLGWVASGAVSIGTIDTALARTSAGVVEVNNGTPGSLGIFNATSYAVASAGTVSWNADTNLNRNAAGVLEINNGTPGTYRELKARSVIHNGVTVANLPGSPTAGQVAYVTDGTASLAWGATVTGGSSTKYLVWYNGTNWTVAGK